MTTQPILKLRNIKRRFMLGETSIDALNSVSLDIHAGEFLAVWGPSGSGKSTLMNIIVSNRVQYFPLISVQFFPLCRVAVADFYAA
jgi:ABC-type glutathione transport system ATPase component